MYRNKEGYVMHLPTQVNIRQLKGMLDTYFTIPTFGNIFSYVSQYDTPPLWDVNDVRQAFAVSACKLLYYQSMEQTWSSTTVHWRHWHFLTPYTWDVIVAIYRNNCGQVFLMSNKPLSQDITIVFYYSMLMQVSNSWHTYTDAFEWWHGHRCSYVHGDWMYGPCMTWCAIVELCCPTH